MESNVGSELAALLADVGQQCGVSVYHVGMDHGTLRVEIDCTAGVTLETCTSFSRALSERLRNGRFAALGLEVSSPGVERRLYRPEHFARQVGRHVRVAAANGLVEGVLSAADDTGIKVACDAGEPTRLAYADIRWARIRLTDAELFGDGKREKC